MSEDDNNVLQRYRTVAVVGAGVIGASWVAVFLAHGLTVVVSDPREGVEAEVRDYVARAMPTLARLGAPLAGAGVGERLRFEPDLERAVAGVDLVQENGPERIDFKRGLWRRVEAAAPAKALFLSSSSALPATEQAREMHTPQRLLIGHPFNPPHIIPLVEVVPGDDTSAAAVKEAVAFYRAVGKVPKVLRREVSGFVANRLQSAIFRECVALVAAGVVTIDELDDIVTHSVGLRWAVDGPFASFHLGGGDGGLRSFVQQFGPGMEKRWASMQREVRFDEATTKLIFEQADASYGRHTRAELEAARDARQIAILQALAKAKAED
ncbi:MAG: 3-hydroxyacyl-CoA dehydrogenase NAD-binding domain-containing protein [Pseudomonadota bacterium]|nr:3-hydroxyacyl-CoA dehydrogenase NAD-binding domain-containing protein [Pseudomonadota bacterium]